MKSRPARQTLLVFSALFGFGSCAIAAAPTEENASSELAQVPTWSRDDLDFFPHGSMSTEVVPESVLRAFIKTYSDLFAKEDLSNLGMIPDARFGWPVGFSRKEVPHLGGLSAVGTAVIYFIKNG